LTIPPENNEPEWLLPFDFMQIGESFFIPTVQPAKMLYTIDSAAKRSGVRIKAFITTYKNYMGVRVWRIS
jgi:hypothetical protein